MPARIGVNPSTQVGSRDLVFVSSALLTAKLMIKYDCVMFEMQVYLAVRKLYLYWVGGERPTFGVQFRFFQTAFTRLNYALRGALAGWRAGRG